MAYSTALNSPTSPLRESKKVESSPGMFSMAIGTALEMRSSITPGSFIETVKRKETVHEWRGHAYDAERWDADVSEQAERQRAHGQRTAG